MCCLRYEHDTYEREYATFPKVDSIIETPAGKCVVIESNFLTGKIKATVMGDKTGAVKVFTKKDVKVVGYLKKKEVIDDELKQLEEK